MCCLSSNYLPESSLSAVNYCPPTLIKPFRAVKCLSNTPRILKEITIQLTLSWRDPSRQAGGTQELFVKDSPRGVCSHCCPSSFEMWQLTQSFFWAQKYNALSGPNGIPGSLWEGYIQRDCRKLKTFFPTRKIKSLYKQVLRTGHKPRDYILYSLKRMQTQ